MNEFISDNELERILKGELPEDKNDESYSELILMLARALEDERKRRKYLEDNMKEVEGMLKSLKAIEASRSKLQSLKEDLTFPDEEKFHYSTHEKILACSVWLLLRAKYKRKAVDVMPGFSELRENLLEMQTDGHWSSTEVPSASELKSWHKKYDWEKIFSDYFFTFIMNKGFGVDLDYNEFIPELYKKWKDEIDEIDD